MVALCRAWNSGADRFSSGNHDPCRTGGRSTVAYDRRMAVGNRRCVALADRMG